MHFYLIGSTRISAEEFCKFGYLFDISKSEINKVFKEFDVNGDNLLNYKVCMVPWPLGYGTHSC